MKKRILTICFLLAIFGNLRLICAGPVIFYTDRNMSPGKIYYFTGGIERPFFQASSGRINYSVFGDDGILYFSDADSNKLYRLVNGKPSLFHQHTASVNDIVIHPDGRFYFSESKGAGGDGIIYRLVDGAAQIYYNVRLSDVNGFWNGNFAFAPNGTLYLSTGDRTGASIYKVLNTIPMPIYNDPTGSIGGFDFDNTGMIYYTDGSHTIYKLNPLTGVRTVFRNDASHSFADVSVMKSYIAVGPGEGRPNTPGAGTQSKLKGISNLEIRCSDNQPGSDRVVYAGTLKNGLYKTINGGTSWERLQNFPDVAALSLKVMADGNTVYAGTSDGVYVSTDGGATWTPKNNGLPDRKMVSEFVIDPDNPTCFYVGLGYYNAENLYGGGVYWTSNSGDNWGPLSTSKTRKMSVTSIRFDPNDPSLLWVATYGSGVITLFKE